MESTDPVTVAALETAGADGAAWVAALARGIPATDDPWLAPVAGTACPPELELPPRDPR